MRRFPLCITVAIFTFSIGIVVTTFWIILHIKHFERVAVPQIAKNAGAEKIISCPDANKPSRNNVEATINEKGKASWKWSETRLSRKENLGVVQFVNANEGWVGGDKGALYKTTDSGKTWQRIPLGIPPDSYIVSISFANPYVGWIVAFEEGNVYDDINSVRSWILNTTDGGKSWYEQYADKALEISRVKFIDEREGWAIGSKIPRSVGYEGFILHTTDGGKSWANVSAYADTKEQGNLGSVVNIYAEQPSQALILKFNRNFYSTNNNGMSWQGGATLPDEPPQSLLGSSGFGIMGKNRLWAAGGADSIEGMWGTIAVMEDCKWTEYSVGEVYFGDAIFLSDNDVLVCGTIPTPGHEMPRSERDGLIMQSSDKGRNWTIVYRNSAVPHINSLALADADNVWAVGEKGCILHLQHSSTL